MRRILQIVSALMAFIAVALTWRIAEVVSIAPPVFGPTASVKGDAPILAPRKVRVARPTTISAIVNSNLFEAERGKREDPLESAPAAALPPPTNLTLNGIMFIGGEPIAIVTNTKAAGSQLTVKSGEMVDVYEVGNISSRDVTLLGPGGQKFALALTVQKGGAPAAARAAARSAAARNAAARNAPEQTAARGVRPQPTRPATPRTRANSPAATPTRGARPTPPRPRGGEEAANPSQRSAKDAAMARLEALRKLRAAAAEGR